MAIGVEGQYIFQFSIGELKDFINEDDLIEFSLIEDAGNILPTFELAFRTQKKQILGLLHEKNNLKISYGRTRDGLVDSSLNVLTIESEGVGTDKTTIYVAGSLSALAYTTNSNLFISQELSALEVMEEVVRGTFIPEFNITRSRAKQRWIQPNISNKKFVNELWLHMDLLPSFPAVGISSDGRFIVKDVKKEVGTQPKWRFTKDAQNPKTDIVYDDDYTIKTRTGLINNLNGYGREKKVYNLEEDSTQTLLKTADPVAALTKELARREDIKSRFGSVVAKNDNTHDNYWEAYDHNLVHLASFGNVQLTLSFQKTFIPIRVLDLTMFRDTNSTQQAETASYISGLYFVHKVARTVANRQFITTVGLCRESLNDIRTETSN